ncbi:MAG: enoyl-CoA hydratase/isomerase family protein [Halomonadaceae bacterium]|nr:MAG: enoyl-CoA hydratase/isomerase family protein [Halomonadaceae bacterium]
MADDQTPPAHHSSDTLLCQTLPCAAGAIGLITLNSPKSLNALSLPMLEAMLAQLADWESDEAIAMVVLCGAGERAFCAGGDVRFLYQELQASPERPERAEHFFAREYRLNYRLHSYTKPVVCWGHGAIMGGGMGLFQASRYRMVTPSLKLAMPELSIGLFPDVGASHFLNRLPGNIGMFMGLTGATLNIADALRVGLADFAVPEDGLPEMLQWLQREDWSGRVETNDQHLHGLLQRFASQYRLDLSESNLEHHEQFISRVCRGRDVVAVVNEILSADGDTDWFRKAQQNLAAGCPTSAHLVFEQLHRGLQLGLADIFQMELNMAVHCLRHKDFMEGVRARIIDKDQQPQWAHPDVASVPAGWVRSHFQSPWPEGEHPLADLDD